MQIIKVNYPYGTFSIKVYNKQICEICRFSIKEESRGRGFGKRLLYAAVRRCPVPLILATVRADNEFWWRTNIKLGFKLVDRIYKTTGDVCVFLRNKTATYPRGDNDVATELS